MAAVKIRVDQKEIEVEEGANLLESCLERDIYIPNLCHLKGMAHPPASCRLCFVEIDGVDKPVTACTVRVEPGLVVRTDTPRVRDLQRSGLQFLLSVHKVDCAHCPANKRCALQKMAKFLKVGLKPKNLPNILKEPEEVLEHPYLNLYPNRCVLCGRCIYVCRERHGRSYLTFAKRGFDTVISFYGEEEVMELPCEDNPACVEVCPVAAITLKKSP
jgi:NADH dehydrogenase/NADH:ubiquinone oxidoreductase subunit G